MSSLYYVEPDYWVPGYSVDDYTPGLVFASGASYAASVVQSAGNYKVGEGGFLIVGTASVFAGGSYTQSFPGINLNAKSGASAAGAVTINSNGALIEAHSSSRMTGRPFWEMTTPASGTWTIVVPQAEGTGE